MFLRAFLAACAALWLSACSLTPPLPHEQQYTAFIPNVECVPATASTQPPVHAGLTWTKSPNTAPLHTVCWETVPEPTEPQAQQLLAKRCNADSTWNGAGCVMFRSAGGTCWVLSTRTIEQARLTLSWTQNGWGLPTLWEHEVEGHCSGWDHPGQSVLRPLLKRW